MNSNGIITAPINARADVATVLGVSSTSVTTLCTSPNINKWAKYKPVELSNPFHQNDQWYGGDDGKCGLNFKVIEIDPTNKKYSFEKIRDAYKDTTQWEYSRPTKYYRLGDFNGYQHNALCPFQTNYKTTSTYTIPAPSVGSVIFSYNMFNIDLEGGDILPEGNLKLSDFLYKTYNGADFYIKDAKLGAVILIGENDPFDENASWTTSFNYDCIQVSDKTIAECEKDGIAKLEIPVDYFVSIQNYRKQTYKLIGGLFFGYNNNRFVPLPYDNQHYPIVTWKFKDRGDWAIISDCIGWSQWHTYSEWNDVKWVYTEDMIAIRPISQSYLQLKLRMYTYSYPGTNEIILNASNVIISYSDEDGVSNEGNGYVMNSNHQAVSSDPISEDNANPTEVIIACDNIISPKPQEGFEFHIDIYYQYGASHERTKIYGMDFRYTSNYK